MLVLSDYGQRMILGWAVRDDTPTDPIGYLFLFTNDFTPLRTSDLVDFTLADDTDFPPFDVDRAIFAAPATVGALAETTGPPDPITWTNPGSTITIYGYVIVNAAETEWVLAERFGTPRVLQSTDELELTLQVTARTDPGA